MNFAGQVHRKAIELSRLVLQMTTQAGSGHPSSALSLVHIVTVLMYRVMHYDEKDPWSPSNDRLVLSEGHAVPVVYAAYADLGGVVGADSNTRLTLTRADLESLRRITSPLDGHPNPSTGFPFFDCATGSLGQGLSCACGLALSARLDKIDKHIYVLIGDAESREGQIWEACDFLVDRKLSEVIPIFNCNGLGQSDPVSPQQSPGRIAQKLKAYGFRVSCVDGHDPDALLRALTRARNAALPVALVARTVKGWGVEEMQRSNYHGKTLKPGQLSVAYANLDTMLDTLGFTSPPPGREMLLHVKPPPAKPPERTVGRLGNPDFAALLEGDPYLATFKKGTMSVRRGYGLALRELARVDPRIVGLDGDVKNSTFSQYLAQAQPERFFECRIAEQNMVSVACGLGVSGRIPFVSSFAKFLVRGYDQLELAIISKSNIKLCGSHAGVNIAADGPSQMGLTDLAFMRSFTKVTTLDGNPLLVIFNPACPVTAYKCVQLMADFSGACYMRTLRPDLPILYEPDEQFEIGGAKVLREGRDIAILASGYMVHACRKLANQLAEAGIEATIIDCYSLPLKPEIVADAAETNNGRIVTVEDNYPNGLGAEVASIVAADPSINAVVRQMFARRQPKSGLTPEDVLDFVGLGI